MAVRRDVATLVGKENGMTYRRFSDLIVIATFVAVPWLATQVAAQGGDAIRQAEAALQAAINKETVEGDSKGAIEAYLQIVARYPSARAVAARAMLRVGQLYERLEDARHRQVQVYERIVREFADQRDVAADAGTRLARLTSDVRVSPQGATRPRVAWTMPADADVYGKISRDGRYLPFENWRTGDVFIHDLATGEDRRVTNTAIREAGRPRHELASSGGAQALSWDAGHLAYSWFNGATNRHELRVADLTGAGVPRSRLLFDNEDVTWVGPYDWTPDGKWVAALLRREGGTGQVAMISTQDGSLRVLKSVEWDRLFAADAVLSPDGRYLAFNLRASGSNSQDIFVLATDASRELEAVVHPATDEVVGWSPDGRSLVFSSNRSRSPRLWVLPFRDGRFQDQPRAIGPDFPQSYSLGISASGSVYSFLSPSRTTEVKTASLDFATGRLLSSAVDEVQAFVRPRWDGDVQWSPDGKSLAFAGGTEAGHFLGIYTIGTRKVLELKPELRSFGSASGFRWTPDGRSVAGRAVDVDGRLGIFQVDAQTGEMSLLARAEADDRNIGLQGWAPDGKSAYIARVRRADTERQSITQLVERTLASGDERELTSWQGGFGPMVSPNGRYVATMSTDPSTKSSALLLIATSGGERKELMPVALGQTLVFQTWAPDSRSVLVSKRNGGAGRPEEHWWVPVDGREPRQFTGLMDIGGRTAAWRLHPDGRQVILKVAHQEATPRAREVLVLEHLLAAEPAKR